MLYLRVNGAVAGAWRYVAKGLPQIAANGRHKLPRVGSR